MNNELNTALNSLSEQTNKLNVALHYVNGDMEKARQMVAGSYKDMYAIKGKFMSSSISGAFLIFFNSIYSKPVDMAVTVITTYAKKNFEASLDWRLFEKEILDLMAGGDNDDHLAILVANKFRESFNISFGRELCRFLETDNAIAIERVFQKILQFILNIQRIDMKIEYQKMSSLEMELLSASSHKLTPADLMKNDETAQAQDMAYDDTKDDAANVEGVKLIINAALILSPIKGKDITKLVPGDRIRVSVTDMDANAVSVMQALDAYKNGEFKPVTARIKSIDFEPNKGCTIYGIIARGIYIKIVEEELNIKVAMDPTYEMARRDQADVNEMNIPLLVLFIVVFVIVMALVLLYLL